MEDIAFVELHKTSQELTENWMEKVILIFLKRALIRHITL